MPPFPIQVVSFSLAAVQLAVTLTLRSNIAAWCLLGLDIVLAAGLYRGNPVLRWLLISRCTVALLLPITLLAIGRLKFSSMHYESLFVSLCALIICFLPSYRQHFTRKA